MLADTDRYPFYNIISNKSKDEYTIELAVAGFSKEDISITVEDNNLNIEGKATVEKLLPEQLYDFRGISTRGFKRTFVLGKNIEPKDVKLENGILSICLVKTPDTNTKKLIIK